MCIKKLRNDIEEKYGEWLEEGYPLDHILLTLLEAEREKNNFLEKRLAYVQNTSGLVGK
jgi:hypothetical protein